MAESREHQSDCVVVAQQEEELKLDDESRNTKKHDVVGVTYCNTGEINQLSCKPNVPSQSWI